MLLVFVDDATGELMEVQFARSESTFTYFASVRRYLTAHGRPVAFYSDKASIFRVNRKQHRGDGLTQFGRAMPTALSWPTCRSTTSSGSRSSAR